jgi:hypothetical protein
MRLAPARYPIARDRFNLTSRLTRQRQTLCASNGGPFSPSYSQTATLSTIPLQIAPDRCRDSSGEYVSPQPIGSHLGNMGPFWQIRVPLSRVWAPFGKLRVPLGKLGSHLGDYGSHLETRASPEKRLETWMCRRAIESEPPPRPPPAGSPLPPGPPFEKSRMTPLSASRLESAFNARC